MKLFLFLYFFYIVNVRSLTQPIIKKVKKKKIMEAVLFRPISDRHSNATPPFPVMPTILVSQAFYLFIYNAFTVTQTYILSCFVVYPGPIVSHLYY